LIAPHAFSITQTDQADEYSEQTTRRATKADNRNSEECEGLR
jgi:hypothetical protein